MAREIYRLYGLTVQSPLRLPCPAIDPEAADARVQPDVVLTAAPVARFESARHLIEGRREAADWFACCRMPDGDMYIRWQHLFEFLVSPDGRRILYNRHRRATVDSFTVYLLGQVISFALLARGVEALHGTVSVVDGGAIAFVGECGEGKSTLAAAMLARRCPVLTDDLVVTGERNGAWLVEPGLPRIKLFPSVARRLLGQASSGGPMNTGTSKLVLRLEGRQAKRVPVELRAIYVLSRPGKKVRKPVRIEPLSGQQAFLEVARAAFNLVVRERSRLANQFAFASRLAAAVPVRRLVYPRNLALLPSVCDAVLSDLGA